MKGIAILVIGSPTYAKWAANMLCSLRSNAPQFPIQLIVEESLKGHFDLNQFHEVTEIAHEDCYQTIEKRYHTIEKLEPGLAKTRLYKYLVFDETLYLDVDGLIIKDIEPLWDNFTGDYHSLLTARGTYAEKEWPGMIWCLPETVREHYGIEPNKDIAFINSSLQFIRKSETCDRLYKRVAELVSNPIPKEKHFYQWGGGQPDELYMNIGLSLEGIDPEIPNCKEPILFTTNQSPLQSTDKIYPNYYGVGLWGAKEMNHFRVIEYYEMMRKSTGGQYKIDQLFKDKFVHSK